VKQVKDGTSTVGLLHAADISEILSTGGTEICSCYLVERSVCNKQCSI